MDNNLENQCERIESVLPFIEGQLESADLREFEQHLLSCGACLREVNVQKRISNALRHSFAEQGMPELPQNFSKKVTLVAEGSVSGLRDPRERKRFVAVVAFASMVVATLVVVQSNALIHAMGSLSMRVLGFLAISLYFLQSAASGFFRILKTACYHLLPNTSVSVFALGLLFLIATGAFLTLSSRSWRVDADRS